jgi:Zn-dependent protease
MLKKFKLELKKMKKIPLTIHWSTLFLFLIFVYYYSYMGVVLCAIAIASILFHEYAHAWMAIHTGNKVEKIVMYAFGAGAYMHTEDLVFNHRVGSKIAAAGPAASFILFLVGLPLWYFLPRDLLASQVVAFFTFTNLILGIFNLLPLFPCDGGRLVYHAFASKLGAEKGVNIATYISYALCGIGIIISICMLDFWMLFIFGLLIFMAYGQRIGFMKVIYGIKE